MKLKKALSIMFSILAAGMQSSSCLAYTGDVLQNSYGGANIVGSTGNIDVSGVNTNNANISVNSGNSATINWGKLNVGAGQTLNFDTNNATVLNRVTGVGLSTFAGTVSSTGGGNVVISNPSGMLLTSTGAFVMSGALNLTTEKIDGGVLNTPYDHTGTIKDTNSTGAIKLFGDVTANGSLTLSTKNGSDFKIEPSSAHGVYSYDINKIQTDGATFNVVGNNPVFTMESDGSIMIRNGSIDNANVVAQSGISIYNAKLNNTDVKSEKGSISFTGINEMTGGSNTAGHSINVNLSDYTKGHTTFDGVTSKSNIQFGANAGTFKNSYIESRYVFLATINDAIKQEINAENITILATGADPAKGYEDIDQDSSETRNYVISGAKLYGVNFSGYNDIKGVSYVHVRNSNVADGATVEMNQNNNRVFVGTIGGNDIQHEVFDKVEYLRAGSQEEILPEADGPITNVDNNIIAKTGNAIDTTLLDTPVGFAASEGLDVTKSSYMKEGLVEKKGAVINVLKEYIAD